MSTNKNESTTANAVAKSSADVKGKSTPVAPQNKTTKEETTVRFVSRRVWPD